MRADIEAAAVSIDHEIAPARGDGELAALTLELARFMALAGGTMPTEHRSEWIDAARFELRGYPFGLVMNAIAYCRRRVFSPPKMVPAVIERIEEDVARLDGEQAMIGKLLELSRA